MSAYIAAELRHRVKTLFSNRCAYCQTPEALTAVTFEIEHIIPRAAGGETALENLCLACPTCNRHKARRQSFLDSATDNSVALFHPQQQIWREHFAWSDDAAEIVGLTPTGRATIAALKMNRPPLIRLRRMWRMLGEHPAL